MTSELKYYVYYLKDPITNLPFYIGKGEGRRAYRHFTGKKSKIENPYKYNKIQSLIRKGTPPVVEILIDGLDENTAYTIEVMLIKVYGRKGIDANGVLTNRVVEAKPPHYPGISYEQRFGKEKADRLKKYMSDLFKGREVSEEDRKKISLGVRNNAKINPNFGMRGKRMSEVARNNMRKPKTISEEVKQRLSIFRRDRQLGKKQSESTKKKQSESKLGDKNPQYGIPITKEARDKISKSLKSRDLPQRKTWKILKKSGEVFICKDLTGFCKEHRIDYSTFKNRMKQFKYTKGYLLKCPV